MEMKDRIRLLLDAEKINSARFAEAIEVQRSAVSHILAGRNNPSFDIIQRIAQKFPKINLEWLITGKGSMYKIPVQRSIFDTDDSINQPGKKAPTANLTESRTITNVTNRGEGGKILSGRYEGADSEDTSKELTVQKIVIFYSDRTFVEYRPSIS
ncbi:MAG TPA: helix-turn-helix transcriptional regulator [Tenuifilaceae bacterium]|nr:helix-turn-helix transcriptional regulator [Tenuifilaceae bacterium]